MNFRYEEEEDDLPSGLSKTQKKHAIARLQALGERLLEMRPEQWKKLPVTDSLRAALDEYNRVKSPEAKRRHKQYIGKLMKGEDELAILAVLEKGRATSNRTPVETTVQRLMSEGEKAIQDTAERYSGADRHQLRQLVRLAIREEQENPESTEGRLRIETYLRELAALSH